jgi:hypothetical protein
MAQATDTTAVLPTNIKAVPTDPFIVLLRGVYVPIPMASGAPDLGLEGIDLNDGTYSRTRIYPVFGIPDAENSNDNQHRTNVSTTPIGNFYAQLAAAFSGTPLDQVKIAYQLPGGAITQRFLSGGFVPFPDGKGGQYLEGAFDLTITDATGIYKDFKGGHNHMVDRLHALADGRFNEFCFCNISKYEFPYAPQGVYPAPPPAGGMSM